MTLQLQVPSMVCSGCSDTVTKAIKNLDANATVAVDLDSKTVSVESTASTDALKQAIEAIGHTVS